MRSSVPVRKTGLLLGLAGSLLAFAAGVFLASAFLAEWRVGAPAERAVFLERYRQLATHAGLVLEPGEPRTFLITSFAGSRDLFWPKGEQAMAWLTASRAGYRVEVLHGVRGSGSSPEDGRLGIDFSLDGEPRMAGWWSRGGNLFRLRDPATAIPLAERLSSLLVHPGESLGARRLGYFSNAPRLIFPIQGSSPPEHVVAMAPQNVISGRRFGKVTEATTAALRETMTRFFTWAFWSAVGLALVLGVFVVLLLKARISVVNGALLALIALLTLPPTLTLSTGWWPFAAMPAIGLSVWIFLLWSCGESLLRSTDLSFTTSLDALRTGRLGPRGGRALLLGTVFGAALAGLRLALLGLAEVAPGAWPTAPSLSLPLFTGYGSPVAEGIALAAGIALVLALAFRVLPVRWAPWAAALAAGILLSPLSIHPFAAQAAAGSLVAGLLVYVALRHGLTALLITAVVSSLLPAAAFSALHLDWMAGGFAATALPPLAFVLLGWLGLSRSSAAEVQRLSQPGFVRRLEEERRLKHEMDLLARMQKGLLPRSLPRIEGYEIAARSVLANEAGGDLYDLLRDDEGYVWLAAGDVAGHGYSCAIAQAMTKAALVSLIGRSRTPAEVLQRIDRVLRAAGAKRFTTLALLRLRAETGEAILSNAGHPYPLLAAGGEVKELALPSLPLGQGPARGYQDHALHLAPGAALVFCSDGLFEATDHDGVVYGYDRARTVLEVAASRGAGKILEALMAGWRHHLRTVRPADDTTIVVLKREDGR